MLTVTLCRSECCVPSGLDFEVNDDSVVHYFVSNYLLGGLRVAVNMTWALFRVKCWDTWKSAHPPLPLWQTCKVLCPWALFRETTVRVCENKWLYSLETTQTSIYLLKAYELIACYFSTSVCCWYISQYPIFSTVLKFLIVTPVEYFITLNNGQDNKWLIVSLLYISDIL